MQVAECRQYHRAGGPPHPEYQLHTFSGSTHTQTQRKMEEVREIIKFLKQVHKYNLNLISAT